MIRIGSHPGQRISSLVVLAHRVHDLPDDGILFTWRQLIQIPNLPEILRCLRDHAGVNNLPNVGAGWRVPNVNPDITIWQSIGIESCIPAGRRRDGAQRNVC